MSDLQPDDDLAPPREGDIVLFLSTHCSILGHGHPTETIGRVKRDGSGLHAGGKYLETAIGPVTIIARHSEKRSRLSRKPASMAETVRFNGDIFNLLWKSG